MGNYPQPKTKATVRLALNLLTIAKRYKIRLDKVVDLVLRKLTRFELAHVEGTSMLPTFHSGQVVLVEKGVVSGEVLACKHPHADYTIIKRVEYEFFDVDKNEVQYFVVGDNLDSSIDSRHFGAIPESNIVGRVIW